MRIETQDMPRHSSLNVISDPNEAVWHNYLNLVKRRYHQKLNLDIEEDLSSTGLAKNTYVCMDSDVVAGGLQIHVIGHGYERRLPSEKDGVDIQRIHKAKFPNQAMYAEVNRNVTHPRYRAAEIQARLLARMTDDLNKMGCKVIYWLASASQTKNSHRIVRSLGAAPEVIGTFKLVRGGNPNPRDLLLSVVDTQDWKVPEEFANKSQKSNH